jgi:hypothetical protein
MASRMCFGGEWRAVRELTRWADAKTVYEQGEKVTRYSQDG